MPPLLGAIFPILLLAAVLFALGAVMRTPRFRGWLGELQVNLAARFLLDRTRYHLVRDVTIPAGDGTTQIDHIIVSRQGVFVLETKNMNGLIVGQERQEQWRQYFGKTFFLFQNPLRQNYKHTQTLIGLLGLPAEYVISLVVFVGGAKLSPERPANVKETGEFIRFIKARTAEVLSQSEVERVLATIASMRLAPGPATNAAHIAHVRDQVAAKTTVPAATPKASAEREAAARTCPSCGSEMVLRTGKKGARAGIAFWGCSRFPACRGSRGCEEQGQPVAQGSRA